MESEQRRVDRRRFLRQTAAGAVAGIAASQLAVFAEPPDPGAVRSYNPGMEYRPLGKTGLFLSAVCLGGHWKRVDRVVPSAFQPGSWLDTNLDDEGFQRNRADVVSRCIEHGINYIDACVSAEVMAYSRALRGRREAVYLGFSWAEEEMRNEDFRTEAALLGSLDKGLRAAELDYVDLWRITMHEQSSRHTDAEVEEMMKALAKAKEQGKARFAGFSSHDRPHIKKLIEQYPDVVDAVCTPYTANSKELPQDSLFGAVREHRVGVIGIKPFASGSLFANDAEPSDENSERARLAIRYILANDAITAPIPGLAEPSQVDNVVLAVQERRKLDMAEQARLKDATAEMTANLPEDYQWLRDWEWV